MGSIRESLVIWRSAGFQTGLWRPEVVKRPPNRSHVVSRFGNRRFARESGMRPNGTTRSESDALPRDFGEAQMLLGQLGQAQRLVSFGQRLMRAGGRFQRGECEFEVGDHLLVAL